MNDGMSSEHFLWNVEIHTAVFYAQMPYVYWFGLFLFSTPEMDTHNKTTKFQLTKNKKRHFRTPLSSFIFASSHRKTTFHGH
ncbi:MAG: hypothetical protein RR235_05515, partial [Oscillospiraceae bacterium]